MLPARASRGLSAALLLFLTVLLAAPVATVAQNQPDPWTAHEVLDPAVLASVIRNGKAPLVISVAFPVLYRNRHITGALDAGSTAKPEGIAALRKLVAKHSKDDEVVIYCGCCPMVKCPNIRPAYRALKEMGFKKIRVLNIPTNMTTDWYAKDYPSELGTAAVEAGRK